MPGRKAGPPGSGNPARTKRLKAAGLTATAPRVSIYRLLEEARGTHLGIEELYQRLLERGESVSLATLYRVLHQFEKAALVRRVRFEPENTVYELETGHHHDHILCTRCGHVEEFVDHVIEEHQSQIAARKGWLMAGHTLVIYGICRGCRSTPEEKQGPKEQ